MSNRGVLTKNYFIDPVTVLEFGAEIENVMTETDRAMEEASEIIAEIASLTERVTGQIKSRELLELCETAQTEIRSFDFLAYGKRVNQGLQNLVDRNEYITNNFIKKTEANTERIREFGAACRRLTELIDYSGESLPFKGLALSAAGSAENENSDFGEDDSSNQDLDDAFIRAGAAEVLEINSEEVITQVWYRNNLESGQRILTNYMIYHGMGNDEEIKNFINWITERRPDLLLELYAVDSKSSRDAGKIYEKIFHEIADAQKEQGNSAAYMEIYNQYSLHITIDDVDTLVFIGSNGSSMKLNDVQKETFVACWNKLVSMELSKEHIIAVMANIYAESGYSARNAQDTKGFDDEDLVDENYVFDAEDLVAFGIIQWKIQSRKQALSDFADFTGGSVYDLETQLEYFQYEMEEGICAADKYWGSFLETESLDEAVDSFCRDVELANPSKQELERREKYAETIYDWYESLID